MRLETWCQILLLYFCSSLKYESILCELEFEVMFQIQQYSIVMRATEIPAGPQNQKKTRGFMSTCKDFKKVFRHQSSSSMRWTNQLYLEGVFLFGVRWRHNHPDGHNQSPYKESGTERDIQVEEVERERQFWQQRQCTERTDRKRERRVQK